MIKPIYMLGAGVFLILLGLIVGICLSQTLNDKPANLGPEFQLVNWASPVMLIPFVILLCLGFWIYDIITNKPKNKSAPNTTKVQ